MDVEQLFPLVQREILTSPAYQGIPFFPEQVQRMRTLEDLIWWLGTISFSVMRNQEYAATFELSFIHYRFDSSHDGLMRLILFLLNLDTPGFLETGIESKTSEQETIHSVAEAIRAAVRRRPPMRKYLAQYIIFEDLGSYDAVTLAQLAEQVEREYTWEFGNHAFASSTRDVAHALARTETERESLRKMLTLALEIGTHHIRCRLAINWLAQVHLRNPAIQKELDDLKEMTVKQIWQKYQMKGDYQ